MTVEERRKEKGVTGTVLIIISVLFVFFMLVLPLISVITNSLSKGFGFYFQSLTTKYVISALKVTIIATVIAVAVNTFFGLVASWLLTKYSFKGKQVLATLIDIPFSISPVIAGLAFIMTFGRLGWASPILEWINDRLGTDIQIVFALPGVVLATIFVTFPFVSRELIPVLNSEGKDEEEAAALMGARGWTIFRRITFPQIKWALLYGIILCTARALGEFGAVNALSKTRGQTFTLPLEIDALYLAGSADSIVSAFAVSSLLVIIAIIVLFVRNIFEYRTKNKEKIERQEAEAFVAEPAAGGFAAAAGAAVHPAAGSAGAGVGHYSSSTVGAGTAVQSEPEKTFGTGAQKITSDRGE